MRPDIVQHSRLTNQVVLLEVAVPWDSTIKEQYVFLLANYERLTVALRRDGYSTRPLALDVSARGLIFTSVYSVLKQIGLRRLSRSRALERLGEVDVWASCWMWSNRNDHSTSTYDGSKRLDPPTEDTVYAVLERFVTQR